MGGAKDEKPGSRHPTPQGPDAAGPGDRHGIPPDDSPGPWGTGQRPFDPAGGKPAANPEEMTRKVLGQAKGDAGPEAAGGKAGQDKG